MVRVPLLECTINLHRVELPLARMRVRVIVVVVSVSLYVFLSVTLTTSTRWQAFSIGNLHGHEECNILFVLNDTIFKFLILLRRKTRRYLSRPLCA